MAVAVVQPLAHLPYIRTRVTRGKPVTNGMRGTAAPVSHNIAAPPLPSDDEPSHSKLPTGFRKSKRPCQEPHVCVQEQPEAIERQHDVLARGSGAYSAREGREGDGAKA